MKYSRIALLFIILLTSINCKGQKSSTGKIAAFDNEKISFDFDTSRWYTQSSSEVINFMAKNGLGSQFSAEDLVAVYTYNKSPIINYPSIMVLNTKTTTDPPPLDQLEKELGAVSLSMNDIDPNMKLTAYFDDFDFRKPLLIKEKKQIIMETTAKLATGETLKVRQTMFFEMRNIVVVQISYIENRDEKRLDDYNRILDTMKF